MIKTLSTVMHKLTTDDTEDSTRGQKIFKLFLRLAVGLASVVLLILLVGVFYSNIEAVDQFVIRLNPWLGFWRLLLFLVVFGRWSHWTAYFARWANMTAEQQESMLDSRWRLAFWLLVMEALFSQNVLNVFINQLLSTGVLS